MCVCINIYIHMQREREKMSQIVAKGPIGVELALKIP